jgi:sRNA-binding carbon storage regulator CsrA
MLVLKRNPGERIMIVVPGLPEPIVITVVDAVAHIGILAPKEVQVDREEVYNAKLAGGKCGHNHHQEYTGG